MNQGWLLSILSSALCVLGCLTVFIDDLYKLLFPKWITTKFPFEISQNYGFLVASLGFSSGCLLFTSLYRLLPHATDYLADSHLESRFIMPYLMGSYLLGIIICMSLNGILHVITSDSVVHCSHGGDTESHIGDHHGHSHHDHNHQDAHDGGDDHEMHQDHEDQHHEDQHEEFNSHDNHGHHHHHHDHHHFVPSSGSSLKHSSIGNHNYGATQSEPQINKSKSKVSLDDGRRVPKKKFSLIHLFGKDAVGECKGYSSAEVCVNDETKRLHYCELPLSMTESHGEGEIHSIYSSEPGHVHGHGIAHHQTHDNLHEHEHGSHGPYGHHDHPDDANGSHDIRGHDHTPYDSKSFHSLKSSSIYSDHHHHISTPLSRLLMIGIQTTLAITLHKLPEGFVTYITSEADSKLGIEIFLSLLVHNFIEGFLMCLPLYYLFSTDKNKFYGKFKAVLISGGLGGIAQPLGALLGYVFLQFNPILPDDDDEVDTLNFLFGVVISVTSGFLTVVSLSMFGSAIAFNNRSINVVIVWAAIGIAVLGGSLILTS